LCELYLNVAVVVEEEVGVDGDRGDWRSRERRGLREFGMKSETTRGGYYL
jgi:hypothetical protein